MKILSTSGKYISLNLEWLASKAKKGTVTKPRRVKANNCTALDPITQNHLTKWKYFKS
jgi:hypothetical protein